jgi:hypothetical protein
LRRPVSAFLGFAILFSIFAVLPRFSAAQATALPGAPAPSIGSTLRGIVTDPSGALVPDAEVTLQSSEGNVRNTRTTMDGRYVFAGLAAGRYTIRVTAPGFAIYNGTPVQLSVSASIALNIRLRIETQQVRVDVSSEAGDETDPNKNGDAIVLAGKALDDLPTEPSMLQQQLQAMSGGDAPAMYVDGFSGGTMPPKDTIREIRINQNPYSARNDTDPGGGMIEIFTKPGSDKLHGSLFLFGDDSALNTQNPFTPSQPSYYSLQGNANVNGPLGKHASYFLSGNRRSSHTNAVINALVLDASGQNQVPFSQALASPTTTIGFSPRLDLQLGKSSTVVLRYSYSKSQQTNGGIGQFNLAGQGFDSSTATQLFQGSNSQVIGSHVVNDTRFQYVRTRSQQSPFNTDATVLVQGAFTGGGSNAGASHDNLDNYEFQNYLSIQAGKHYFSPGIRLRINRDANVSRTGFNGQFLFSTLNAYQVTVQGEAQGLSASQIRSAGGGASQFSITTGRPSVVIDNIDLGAFYQDDWKITPHFTLSYGLRYEAQNYFSDHRDFAPRLGFAWGLGVRKDKPPRFVLRVGSGIFYSRLPSSNILQAQRQNGVSERQYIVSSPDFYPSIPAPSNFGSQTSPTIYRISPSLRSYYGIMSSIAVDYPLGTRGSLTVSYFNNHGVHALVTRNINAPLPGTYDPANPTSGVRPYGGTQNIDEFDSIATNHTDRLSTNVQFRAKNGFNLYGYYQFRHRNSDAGSGGFPSNGYDVRSDYGRANQDIRQTMYADVNSPLLWQRFHLGVYLEASSGQPFNITVAQDLNGDSQFNDRPSFATDLSRPSVVKTRFGNFDTSPLPNQTIIPVNYAQGPAFLNVSSEIYREFTFGPPLPQPSEPTKPAVTAVAKGKPYVPRKYSIFFAVEAENVINHVNLGTPVGTLGSPLFGRSLGLSGGAGSTNANRILNFDFFLRF